MARVDSKRKMLDWLRTQRRGRRRIATASKDPVARSALFHEAFLPASALGAPSLSASRKGASENTNKESADLIPVPSFLLSNSGANKLEGTSKSGYSFFTFPSEVRNAIYQYAVEYPSCRELFDSYYQQKEKSKRSSGGRIRVDLHTPTVLLLCKQITREALTILRSQPFVIDNIPPWICGHRRPLPITDFISVPTLQNIRFFEFKVTLGEGTFGSGQIWRRVLRYVFKAWSEANSVAHLRVMFKLSNLEAMSLWDSELEDYEKLVDKVRLHGFSFGTEYAIANKPLDPPLRVLARRKAGYGPI